MATRQIEMSGLDAVEAAGRLLQRARRADPRAGVWEAADLQWWWRTPRESDEVDQLLWVDDDGPVAAVMLSTWRGAWQCDPMRVPGSSGLPLEELWQTAIDHARAHAPEGFEVPVSGTDAELRDLAVAAGFTAGEGSIAAWLDPADRPAVSPLPDGFRLVDQSQRPDLPHPMRARSGPTIAERLSQASLYDPALDLAVEAPDGRIAAYSLYWHDPVTAVGLTEPVRVEDDFSRLGWRRRCSRPGSRD